MTVYTLKLCAKLVLSILMYSVIIGCSLIEQRVYEYPSLVRENSGYIFDFKKKTFKSFGGDLVFKLSLCEENDRYKCIISKGINLAVPVVENDLPNSWVFNNLKYEVINTVQRKIDGKSISFSIVKYKPVIINQEDRKALISSYNQEILELEKEKKLLNVRGEDTLEIEKYIDTVNCLKKNYNNSTYSFFSYNKEFGIYFFLFLKEWSDKECALLDHSVGSIYMLTGKKGVLSQ